MSETAVERLRTKIATCGLTQIQISARSGVPQSTISAIGRGAIMSPRMHVAEKIETAIDEYAREQRRKRRRAS